MTGAPAKVAGVRARGRAAIAAGTLRTDRWWAYPLTTFAVLLAFVGYATYAAVANRDYYATPYLSPFYSPCLSFHCGTVPGSAGAPHLGWFCTWRIVTPAVIILVFPLGFRLTCYYYRKAYYRSCWLSPPACAVPEPHRRYTGETRFPLLGQNVHRYFFYAVRVEAEPVPRQLRLGILGLGGADRQRRHPRPAGVLKEAAMTDQRTGSKPAAARRHGRHPGEVAAGMARRQDGGGLTDFTVAVNEGEVVLDVLHRLQATQAGDLAIRWNCKAGKCGLGSAEVNGRPALLCMTRLSSLPAGPVTITPLRTFPVIRDLVTDVSASYDWAPRVPSFALPEGLGLGRVRMQQPDIDRSQEFRKCIECWLCQDVCHVIRDHEDNKAAYAGRRYFIRLAGLDMHPLDVRDWREVLRERHGLGLCNITKCCTEVCPAGIKITDNAIIPMKERSADQRYDPLGRVLRWWRGEGSTTQAEGQFEPHEDAGWPLWPAGDDGTGKGTTEMRVDYYKAFPAGVRAMAELERAVGSATLEPELLELVRVRASQINGCTYCLAMHNRDARLHGEHQTRLDTVAAWREAPFFNTRERAALAWCEALTELPRTGAPDDVYAAVEAEFAQEEIAALTFAIVAINGWNRLAMGLRSDVMSLDGLDLPASAASGSG